MGFFSKLIDRKPPASSQEAVLIHFEFGFKSNGDRFGFDDMVNLEDTLIAVVERHQVGEVDGHEIGSSDGTIFLYGPDADLMLETIEPVLLTHPLCAGARVALRKGGPGSPQTEVQL